MSYEVIEKYWRRSKKCLNRLFVLLIMLAGITLTGCQATKTAVKEKPEASSGENAGPAQRSWYQSARTFEQQRDRYQALGTAVSLDSAVAKTKARHTSVAILQSKLQEVLENLRDEMVKDGIKGAKEPGYILDTRTCLNGLYEQLSPDSTMVKPYENGYRAYVMMHMSRGELWDNWKKSLADNHSYLRETSDSPVVQAWLHPETESGSPE